MIRNHGVFFGESPLSLRFAEGLRWAPRAGRLGTMRGTILSLARSLNTRKARNSRTMAPIFSAVATGMTKTELVSLARSVPTGLAGLSAAAGLVTKPEAGEVALAPGVMTGSRLLMLPGLVTAETPVDGPV